MINIEKEYKTLAAYALFYQLHEQKLTTLDIVKRFVRIAVINSPVSNMTLFQIKALIKEFAGLDMPLAVVSHAVNTCDFLNKVEGTIYFHLVKDISQDERDEYENAIKSNSDNTNIIVEKMGNYISDKLNRSLDSTDVLKIQSDLAHVLIKKDGTDGFKPYIQAFIQEHKDDSEIFSILQTISMGLIVFLGLQEDNIEQGGKVFDRKLTLFLDTEIIFNIMGYNGPEFQQLADDFLNQVNDVKREQKYKGSRNENAIRLEYLPDVRYEIDRFFADAESIRERKVSPTHRTAVLQHILKNCPDTSSVAVMRGDFWHELGKKGISQISCDIPEDSEFADICIACKDYRDEKVDAESNPENPLYDDQYQNLSFLNTVNKLRGYTRRKASLDGCGYIMISNTHDLLSKASRILSDNDHINYPLALNLFDVTSRLWLKLNRGFGVANSMPSLNIAVQASIALRSNFNSMIEEKYNKTVEDYKNNVINKDTLKHRVSALRTLQDSSTQSDPLDFVLPLSEEEVEEYIRSKNHIEYELRQSNEDKKNKIALLEESHAEANLLHQGELQIITKQSEDSQRIIIEKDKTIQNIDSILAKAKKDKIENENAKLKQDYREKENDWYNRKRKYLHKRECRKNWQVVGCIILVCMSIFGIIFSVTPPMELKKWISLFASIVPTILMYMKHDWWLNTIKYAFCPNFRKMEKDTWSQTFQEEDPKPILKKYTESDWDREFSGD